MLLFYTIIEPQTQFMIKLFLIVAPQVIKHPPSEAMVVDGATVVIECDAIGVPPPLIVWRLNWGHIGEPPRVTTSTQRLQDSRGLITSQGEITIRNARKEDEGAYTCEALNSKGNIFANPDTIVHVLRKRA